MIELELVPDTEETHTIGRFGVRISGRQMLISPTIFAFLPLAEEPKKLGSFLNLIHVFPGIFVEKLRWNLDDVKRAKDHFMQQLAAHVESTDSR